MNDDKKIVLKLSPEHLQVIMAHLQVGMYCNVNEAMAEITLQIAHQIVDADQIAHVEAIAGAKVEAAAQRKN